MFAGLEHQTFLEPKYEHVLKTSVCKIWLKEVTFTD